MKLAPALLLALLGAPAAAFAQGTSAQRAACTPDVFRLCSSEIPNVTRIVDCLHREKPRLSPDCRMVMAGDDKRVATATRSLGGPKLQWCQFEAEVKPVDDVWRSWCNDKGKKD